MHLFLFRKHFFDLFLLFSFLECETERCSHADDRRLVRVLSFKMISGECNFCYSSRLNRCSSFSSYLAIVVEGRQKRERRSHLIDNFKAIPTNGVLPYAMIPVCMMLTDFIIDCRCHNLGRHCLSLDAICD